MSCCSPPDYEGVFGAKGAAKEAQRYRRKGLPGSARWLLEALSATGVDGRTVLEVGGGIGGLQIELLGAGAASAVNVELVESYETAARSLLAERGVAGRVERRIADFASRERSVPRADVIVMHRVICCYPDADALMAAACSRAQQRVAITLPRDTWLTRSVFWLENAWLRLRRIAFRAYVHDPQAMLRIAGYHGFAVEQRTHDRFWESLVLQRL